MKRSKTIREAKKHLRNFWSAESQLILDSHIAELEILESIERLLRRQSYHEHDWQFVPSSWVEETANWACECGEMKRVKMTTIYNVLEVEQSK